MCTVRKSFGVKLNHVKKYHSNNYSKDTTKYCINLSTTIGYGTKMHHSLLKYTTVCTTADQFAIVDTTVC